MGKLTPAEREELERLRQEVGEPAIKPRQLTPMELAEKASLERELSGAPPLPDGRVESLGDQYVGRVKGSLESLPMAGAIGGAVYGTMVAPGPGTIIGGVLGAGGGKALENLGESQILGEQKTRQDIYMDPVKEMALEGALAGAGSVVRRGAGLIGKYAKAPIQNTLARLGSVKPGADEIAKASERLGAPATRGMLSDDQMIQKLESAVMQTPTQTGQAMADKIKVVNQAMRGKADELFTPFRSAQTANQLTSQAREQIGQNITQRLKPAVDVYDAVAQKSPNINVAEKSLRRISKNIEQLPYAKIVGTPEHSFARNINDNLSRIGTLDELRNLKSYVGKMAGDRSVPGTMRNTAGEIYDKLARLEQNSITLNMIETTRSGRISNSIGKRMVQDLRGANKIYSAASEEFKTISEMAGMGKVRNYADFTRKLESMSDEKMLSKLFQPGNEKLLTQFQKTFPEAFDTMRRAKMNQIYEKSLTKGEVSIPKLISNAKKMSPNVKRMLFGEGAEQTLKDIETVYNSIPTRVGPSGTPEGVVYMAFNPFSPSAWYGELQAQAKTYILNHPEKFAKFKKAPKTLPKPFTPADAAKRKVFESAAPRGLLQLGDE